jgi:NAD(P)-dependent dehydrogenase (short-subunit alcohol dehydrogenase family)
VTAADARRGAIFAVTQQQTVLLFGASRGLGLGLAREYLSRGWRVIATARDDAAQLQKLETAAKGGLRVVRADITDTRAVASLRDQLEDERLDLLFLVAGISGSVPTPVSEVPPDDAARVFLVNAYYPLVAADILMPLVKPNGVVAFMTSRLGSIALNDYGQWETYRLSKAALNMGARSFFHRHSGHAVLSVSPGWVKTDMGGPAATLDIETSCRSVADAIQKHAKKPGHRYVHYDGSELAW